MKTAEEVMDDLLDCMDTDIGEGCYSTFLNTEKAMPVLSTALSEAYAEGRAAGIEDIYNHACRQFADECRANNNRPPDDSKWFTLAGLLTDLFPEKIGALLPSPATDKEATDART